MPEGKLLQLVAHALHAHAAGERRIDVQRLLRDARALFRRHEMQRAHIVQAIGELDEQHAHVLGDGEQQLAEILAPARPASRRDRASSILVRPSTSAADIRAEQPVDFLARRARVLDRVMQHGGDDRRIVELEIGQDRGDFERMRKIRVAGGALLRAMRLHRIDIGAVEQILVGLRIIPPHPLDEFILPHHGSNGPVALKQ